MVTRMEIFSANPTAPELPLGGLGAHTDPVQIRDIQGLDPVKAEISTKSFATGRGEVKKSTSVGKRNIVLQLGLNPDWATHTVSSLRHLLYAYFMPEEWVKLRFFSDDMPAVDITGWVESFETNKFAQDPEVQVSIICPMPDFIQPDPVFIDGVVGTTFLETTFVYEGTVSTGFELTVKSAAANVGYSGLIEIRAKTPVVPELFSITGVVVDTARYFRMNTRRGSRRAESIAVADNARTNMLQKVTDESAWSQLKPGENSIAVKAAEAGQAWRLGYFNRFGGL